MIPNETLSLIAGFIAMSFVVIAYFVKKKVLYLVYQSACIVFLILSYLFNAQYFAMIGMVIGLWRALTFFWLEHKERDASILWSYLFAGLTIASYFIVNFWILGDAKPLDILCLFASCAYAFIFRIRNLKVVRFTMLAPTVVSILYNILSGAALFVTISYSFELGANVVSIFKYHVIKPHKDRT